MTEDMIPYIQSNEGRARSGLCSLSMRYVCSKISAC